MFWSKVEKIIGDVIPNCVKTILTSCGYDTMMALKNISVNSATQIEIHINEQRKTTDIIQKLDCCNSETYKKQNVFKLLPGHRDFILSLPKLIISHQQCRLNSDESLIQAIERHTGVSVILRELVRTAVQNAARNKERYSDIVRNFATYIFLLCGRSCYDVLYENLPLPSISTVCK